MDKVTTMLNHIHREQLIFMHEYMYAYYTHTSVEGWYRLRIPEHLIAEWAPGISCLYCDTT